jgi:hypothetical protein
VRAAGQRLGGMGGVDVVLRASGNIRSQEPSPGTEVSPGTTVVLN